MVGHTLTTLVLREAQRVMNVKRARRVHALLEITMVKSILTILCVLVGTTVATLASRTSGPFEGSYLELGERDLGRLQAIERVFLERTDQSNSSTGAGADTMCRERVSSVTPARHDKHWGLCPEFAR